MQQLTCSPCPVYSDVTLGEKVRFLFCLHCSARFITFSFGAGVLRLVERGAVLTLSPGCPSGAGAAEGAAFPRQLPRASAAAAALLSW